MTPHAYTVRLGRIALSVATLVVIGASFSDEVLSHLWGLGKRIFFLHDGRTKDLIEAIQAHVGSGGRHYHPSEANQVVAQFNRLNEIDKQHLLNFLRAL